MRISNLSSLRCGVCVCAYERERQSKKGVLPVCVRERERERGAFYLVCVRERERKRGILPVCVREERERGAFYKYA